MPLDSSSVTRPAPPARVEEIHFELKDLLEHPFHWLPRTLLSYPIESRNPMDLNRLVLTRKDTGEKIPIQFSELVRDKAGLHSACSNPNDDKSCIADTDPGSWRNWDPKPGEPFRRTYFNGFPGPGMLAGWPDYYPR
jgi:hypothetical protein